MTEPLRITFLADAPDTVPQLAARFIAEWAPYYGDTGPGDATQDLTACCNRDRLPLALVALDADGNAIGTAALKATSLPTHEHLGPWLAALLVVPEWRGRGVASALVAAIEAEARRLGQTVLYSDTAAGSRLLTRRGWQPLEAGIPTLREPATLHQLDLR